jgi:hypothetical protein
MSTKRARAFIYGTKERKRLAAGAKKNVSITDRVTANRAKAYVNGKKEHKRLAAVIDMNLYINECMTCVPPEPAPFGITAACKSYCLTFALWCMTIFILYTSGISLSRIIYKR